MPEFRGDDGLDAVERAAHAQCAELACKHERCYKKAMYASQAKQSACVPLMKEWQACFKEAKAEMRAAAQK